MIENAENFSNGAALMDISIDQEDDFFLGPFQLLLNGAPLDLTGATLTAWMNVTWNPPLTTRVDMTVAVVGDPTQGYAQVSLLATQTKQILVPTSPPSYPGPGGAPRKIQLGGWQLRILDTMGNTNRLLYGAVYLNRDSSQ